MISEIELKSLYEAELKPKLAGLENMRIKVMWLSTLSIAIFALFFLAIIFLEDKISSIVPYMIVVLIIAQIPTIYFLSKHKKEYRAKFKSEVVSRIVEAIDPSWQYEPNSCVSEQEYNRSDIFTHWVDRYRGDDLIEGKIDKTDFRCSELHSEYKTISTDSKGNKNTRWHTIFKGLFFHADFNKDFQGQTFIEPDRTEKLFGKFGQSKKKRKTAGKTELIKLENVEFEKFFKVYSTDQTEARYILTPIIMEAIVNIRKKLKQTIYLSFVKSRVYCAISFNKKLFEPRIFNSGINYADVEDMYNLFMLNSIVIQQLNLNTRIWTKK